MSSDNAAIELLLASVVDGRTENGRYRQDQLQSLHKTLREEATQICAALQADSGSTASEVEAEYYLTMEAVRHFYDTLDFDKDLKDEYNVAYGKDYRTRRLGVGLVVVRPTSHTRFYSVLTPLAAAISAGNCTVVELSGTLLHVDAVLRTLLTQALDINTFCVVQAIKNQPLLDEAIIVDQNKLETSTPRTNQIWSSANSRCVAIVDRTANIDSAAEAIVTARFRFGGTSPYSPDLVLVNEFVKKEFFEACSRYATSIFAAESGVKKPNGNHKAIKKAIKEAEDKKQISSFGSDDFKLLDILDKSTPILTKKITGRYLPITTYSSLTDAIYSQEFETPLLAGYFFAELKSAKYLAHFLPSHISLINQIPTHLLVGPAAPTTHEPDFLYRYNRNMFSVPRPQFVEQLPAGFQKVKGLLSGEGGKDRGNTTTSSLRELATKPLPPTGQSDNTGIGFFESGIMVGAGIYLSLILPALGFTTYFLSRKGLEYASKFRK